MKLKLVYISLFAGFSSYRVFFTGFSSHYKDVWRAADGGLLVYESLLWHLLKNLFFSCDLVLFEQHYCLLKNCKSKFRGALSISRGVKTASDDGVRVNSWKYLLHSSCLQLTLHSLPVVFNSPVVVEEVFSLMLCSCDSLTCLPSVEALNLPPPPPPQRLPPSEGRLRVTW